MRSKSIICGLTALMMVLMTGCGDFWALDSDSNTATTASSETPDEDDSSDSEPQNNTPDDSSDGGDDSSEAPDPAAEQNAGFDVYAADFTAELFKAAALDDLKDCKSVMISPISVMMAMGMTAEGANGDTLKEMADVLYGGEEGYEDFCNNLRAIRTHAAEDDRAYFSLANSVWYNKADDIVPKQEFTDTLAEVYDAQFEGVVFDSEAVDTVNGWVSEHTKGMIPRIIDTIEPDDRMILVNAAVFEGSWAVEYSDDGIIEKQKFKGADGKEREVTMLDSTESSYISDKDSVGFIKSYADDRYAFMAIMPNEGIPVTDYVRGLTGEKLLEIYDSKSFDTVHVRMPEFSTEYQTMLNDPLKEIGINAAFDDGADFSRMCDTALKISRVYHNTYISVDREGTKAAAATAVIMDEETAVMEPEIDREVILDRPFVYAVIDCENGLPMFIGAYC